MKVNKLKADYVLKENLTFANSCFEEVLAGGFTGLILDWLGVANQPLNSLSILEDSVRFICIGHIAKLMLPFLSIDIIHYLFDHLLNCTLIH